MATPMLPSHILEYLSTKGRNDEVGSLKYIREVEKFCLSYMGKDRGGSFELSNAGRFEEKKVDDQLWEGEQWKIRKWCSDKARVWCLQQSW